MDRGPHGSAPGRPPPRANRPEPRARALARAVLGPPAVVEPGTTYQRRRPEDTVLHQVVRDHLEAFLADARARSPHGLGAPRHVERELGRVLEQAAALKADHDAIV